MGTPSPLAAGWVFPALFRLKRINEQPRALYTASVFVGLVYVGHVFARADLLYLGEGIFPVMAGRWPTATWNCQS